MNTIYGIKQKYITNEKVRITQSKMIKFNQGHPHNIYISNIHVDFDELISADLLEHQNSNIKINNSVLELFLYIEQRIKIYKKPNQF